MIDRKIICKSGQWSRGLVWASKPNVSARSQSQNVGLDFDLEAKMSVLAGLEANILVLALSQEFHLGLNFRLQNSVPVSKISPRLTALLVP